MLHHLQITAVWVLLSSTCLLGGCAFAPRSELTAAQLQSRMLAQQSQAQQSEIENLRTHSHQLEDKLIESEQQLASIDQQWTSDRKRLTALQGELTDGAGNRLPPGLSTQLANLSRRYPSLQFDTATGAAKLDTDVLFDPGEIELKEDAQQMLGEFAPHLPFAGSPRSEADGRRPHRRPENRPARSCATSIPTIST